MFREFDHYYEGRESRFSVDFLEYSSLYGAEKLFYWIHGFFFVRFASCI